ncbi:putative gustatory receptor 2a [Tribolium madens]|uniref:putative gustatory receptor 2a n=1 Tax=Tribolium madens TaxID=41895 RepID=UPI001CF74C23|nr:putative gustatory receptor 2a [Tribolium madens]
MWSENIIDVLKHVWFLSKLFLLCPRSIDEKIKCQERRTFYKIYKYIYNIVAVFLTSYMAYITTNLRITQKLSIVTQLADLIFSASINASGVATVFFCLFYQNRLIEVINKLDKLDNKLKHMLIWKSYKHTQIFITCELFFLILIWISFFLNFMLHCNNTTWRCLYRWIVLYTLSKMSQVMLIQFCAFVVVLKQKFCIVNQYIKQGCKLNNGHYKNFLNQVQIIHNEIIVTHNEIQTIYSVPLLMKIASQFIGIFCSLYFCIFGYIYDDEMVIPQNFHDIFLPLICILTNALEILVTVTVCELTVLEYRRIKKLLYRIPISKTDSILIRNINLFSLQLAHQKLEFSACGFFLINGTLLHTIVGAVTVYLIMFIQFDIATATKDK